LENLLRVKEMSRKETIDERLTRINKQFDELLGNSSTVGKKEESNLEQITRHFGLTVSEAKVWLKQEPNYKPADEKKHLRGTDEDETEPQIATHISEHIFREL
jgi:hypothetical protein